MRIDGKVFLVVLGLGTLALAVLTLWIWPRLAGSGGKALTGRIGLLLATELSVAATLLFTVNALGGFYTSWGQLFGTASAKYTVTNQGPADPMQYDKRAFGVSGSAGGSGGSGGGSGGSAGSGSVQPIDGLRSGLAAGVQVYPPADYASRVDAHHGYPVEVVDLTGGATGLSASAYQQVADTYQVMVVVVTGGAKASTPPAGAPTNGTPLAAAAKPSPGTSTAPAPATVAAAHPSGVPGTGVTGAPSAPGSDAPTSAVSIPGVNVPDGAQGRLFWAQDLQAALRTHYRIDLHPLAWGVAGYGQDGAAAVNLAVQDPNCYGLAAAGGDWTHTDPQQSWPGINTYLGSVPPPDAGLLYDPSSGAVPSRLNQSSGAMRITKQPGLTLAAELAWIGQSIDTNVSAGA